MDFEPCGAAGDGRETQFGLGGLDRGMRLPEVHLRICRMWRVSQRSLLKREKLELLRT